MKNIQDSAQVLLYQTDDGTTRVEVRKYKCPYMMHNFLTGTVCLV